MRIQSLSRIPLALAWAFLLPAQAVDDTVLKQVVIFSRHGVRSPSIANDILDTFTVLPFPNFGNAPGYVTPHGEVDETLMGAYYRLWLTQEGLLTGNDSADAAFVYIRPNSAEVTTLPTAQAFAAGFLPSAKVNFDIYPQTNDPVFDPVPAGVALLDPEKAIAAVSGRLGSDPPSLTTAYAPEFALLRSLLFNYPLATNPPPAPPACVNKTCTIDVTTIPIAVTAGVSGSPIGLGGLRFVGAAIDPFLMEYADGLPIWGQLTAANISQTYRLYTLILDLSYRTRYLDQAQSSNIASHIVRSLVQTATGNQTPGALGNPSTKVMLLLASDVNVTGLAGLFHLDWTLPGYPPDFCAPSGTLAFQLRQSMSTAEYFVRVSYLAQTLDQLRNQTVLTLNAPPAIAPLFIPGCSVDNANFDCPLDKFVGVANQVIDPHSADFVN
jgi:4-phytase/acid phosphatase